tara:strand:- start:16878 stop:17450 length:573 start_codon:yes stop_codon:yes gene_type:complete
MSFYAGATGDPSKAFVQDFTTIPEGSKALATIKAFEVVDKDATQYSGATKFFQVTWKLTTGDFTNREVQQKIKCFDGKPEQIERAKNMLVLVMKLCDYTPSHNNEPTTQELASLCGKIVGIVIGEWSMPKADGSGNMEGNFVRECHKSEGFACETGVKAEVKYAAPAPDSAFSRNKPQEDDLFPDSDVPF